MTTAENASNGFAAAFLKNLMKLGHTAHSPGGEARPEKDGE